MFLGALSSITYPVGLGRDLRALMCGGRTFNSPVTIGAYLGGSGTADMIRRARSAGVPVIQVSLLHG